MWKRHRNIKTGSEKVYSQAARSHVLLSRISPPFSHAFTVIESYLFGSILSAPHRVGFRTKRYFLERPILGFSRVQVSGKSRKIHEAAPDLYGETVESFLKRQFLSLKLNDFNYKVFYKWWLNID